MQKTEASVGELRLYPFKSLDPVSTREVEVGVHSLRNDRRWALINEAGELVNGKRTGRVNQLASDVDLRALTITVGPRQGSERRTFHLERDREALEAYLSSFFGEQVQVVSDDRGRLLDMPVASAVTVVARSTLELLAERLGGGLEAMRRRFRANLEVEGVPPFWEEQLVGEPGIGRRFRVGAVELVGVSLRARCNVPPRDPDTGELDRTFIRRMLKAREASIPPWSAVESFGSLYHLTVNTHVPPGEVGKHIATGDGITLGAFVSPDSPGPGSAPPPRQG